MDIKSIIIASVVVAAVGLIIAVLLSVAEKVFHVEVDEKEIKVREALAGNNCGACGYAGCDALAKAIAKGEAPVNACPPAGKKGAEKIAEIMGAQAGEFIRQTAFVKCSGTCEVRHQKFNYYGTRTCTSASVAPGGGERSCQYGCMGYGSCADVCDNQAIRIINGKAVVDEELCIACGKCVKACPLSLIEIVPYDSKFRVQCSNKQRGKVVKDNCQAGCIGCGMCERNCPNDAVKVIDNVAKIDYNKCTECGLCAQKCPTKVIKEFIN